ncbi:hypothetical protein N0V88_000986 [Collariella sp. IMI 366227]|nr:hypothetical protein N0V88_000986 [Collariella sp. IMI 366227]
MASHATLSAATDDRKARLAKLKSLKRKQPEPTDNDDDDDTSTNLAQEPTTSSPQQQQNNALTPPTQDAPSSASKRPPTLHLAEPTLEEQAHDLEDESRRQAALDAAQAADKGIDLFKLQPKRPNWDLKRELNLKMEVLNVRTENAIARLVRERLAEKKAVAEAARLHGMATSHGVRVRIPDRSYAWAEGMENAAVKENELGGSLGSNDRALGFPRGFLSSHRQNRTISGGPEGHEVMGCESPAAAPFSVGSGFVRGPEKAIG